MEIIRRYFRLHHPWHKLHLHFDIGLSMEAYTPDTGKLLRSVIIPIPGNHNWSNKF